MAFTHLFLIMVVFQFLPM